MIERMNKVTLLFHNSSKKQSLGRLQQLGLVHLDQKQVISEKQTQLLKKKKSYQSVVDTVKSLKDKKLVCSVFPEGTTTLYQKMFFLGRKMSDLEKKILALEEMEKEYAQLKPWGLFDHRLMDKLSGAGVVFRFFITTKSVFGQTDPGQTLLFPVYTERENIWLVGVDYNTPGQTFSFEQIQLPATSLAELETNIKTIRKSIDDEETYLAGFQDEVETIERELLGLGTLIDFEKAKHSLEWEKNGVVYAINGWFPENRRKEIVAFLETEGISYRISKPETDDDVPVKLNLPPAGKIFSLITRIFSLPKYAELDPTLFFAPFFTLFFGLCLGDAGYGAILAVISLVAWFRVSPAYRPVTVLLLILSVSTLVSGILLNTVFGEALFRVPGAAFYFLETGGEIAVFSSYTAQGRTVYPAMSLSLLLGFVQLFFGISLQAVNMYRTRGSWQYTVKPLSLLAILAGGAVIAVYSDFLGLGFNSGFHIGIFRVGEAVHSIPLAAGQGLFYTGLVFFFFFSNPEKKLIARPAIGIWDAYQFITGFLGDFLSYIRLFALGLASGLLGNAFNRVAFMILPDGDWSSPYIIITVVILVLGHGLNLGLGLLGSFVHPLRLTFVEFYKNMNFTGGGREYAPFAIQKQEG